MSMETTNEFKFKDNQHKFESDELGELFAALAKAQCEMSIAVHNSSNPFFKSKYSDLSSVIKASRPCLTKNGLAVLQRVLPNEKGQQFLLTRLCHSSGQWMESKMLISPAKSDVQSLASYITYLKRYSYAAITGVVASDEDDDGESAMSSIRKSDYAAAAAPAKISKEQLKKLSDGLEGKSEMLDSILKHFSISKLSDLTEKQYVLCMERVNKSKG